MAPMDGLEPGKAQGDEAEDDYLTMTFEEPSASTKHETLTQRKKRLAREAEQKSRVKSKAQIAEEERTKRETALNKTTLDANNKGFKMMAALGYKPGTALGKERGTDTNGLPDTRLLEPVGVEMREGKSGVGADAEKKRKFREEVERKAEGEKKVKVGESEFRHRQQRDLEEKRMEGQLWGAMKVAERLEEEDGADGLSEVQKKTFTKPLSSVNVLWRGLVKQRYLNERDRRMRYDLHQSLSRLPTYDDPDEDKEDKIAMSRKEQIEEVDVDIDAEDSELEAFEASEIPEKLEKLVNYLRERWHYCFWCKFRYPDPEMEGCPGKTEEEHG